MKIKKAGFTIVELLIVIVVIGILAAISIVSFNGMQTRANDTVRRNGGSQLEKAYKLYMAETGSNPYNLACGYDDQGTGWIQIAATSGNYIGDSCIDLLADHGYLNEDFTDSTPASSSVRNNYIYMVERCSTNGDNAIALLWHLEDPSESETDNLNRIAVKCRGFSPLRYEQHGMNAGVMIEW